MTADFPTLPYTFPAGASPGRSVPSIRERISADSAVFGAENVRRIRLTQTDVDATPNYADIRNAIVFFGACPANRAATLTPIEALRYESPRRTE